MGYLWMESFGHYVSDSQITSAEAAARMAGKYSSIGSYSQGASWPDLKITNIGDGRKKFHADAENETFSINPNWVTRIWTGVTTIYVGFRLHVVTARSSSQPILAFRDGASTLGTIGLNGSNQLVYWRGGTADPAVLSSSAVPTGVDVYVEVEITFNDTTGSVELFVDQVSVGSASGVDTIAAGSSCDRISWWPSVVASGSNYTASDLYVHDTARQGAVLIAAHFPEADGSENEMAPSTGTDHFAMVDEVGANDDTDYLESSTVGHREQFDFEDVPDLGDVLAVHVLARIKKDSGTIQAKLVGDDLTNEDLSAAKDLGTSYAYIGEIFDLAPDGAAWSVAKVNATEFGVELA